MFNSSSIVALACNSSLTRQKVYNISVLYTFCPIIFRNNKKITMKTKQVRIELIERLGWEVVDDKHLDKVLEHHLPHFDPNDKSRKTENVKDRMLVCLSKWLNGSKQVAVGIDGNVHRTNIYHYLKTLLNELDGYDAFTLVPELKSIAAAAKCFPKK